MAEKRMFSNKVIGSDTFLEMPDSTQNLYFHLSMYADDDGFVDKPKSIMRMTGKKEDDLKLLIAKSFIIPFDTGVIVIRHWRLNNYLRKDRYNETKYIEEKSKLSVLPNGEYELGIPMVDTDKNRIEKNSIDKHKVKQNQPDMSMFSDKVRESINTWIQYKKEKKQIYKPTGLNTLLKKLKQDYDTYGEQYVIDSIDNSIVNNYSGIFPPNKSYQKQNQSEKAIQKEYKADNNGVYIIH